MTEHTEVSEAPPPAVEGIASDPPPLLLFLLWVPVFAVVAWGMMLLFGRKPWDFSPDAPLVPAPPEEGLPPESERQE